MPRKSERQRRFFAAELARAREGKRTETGMDKSKLRDFARKTGRETRRVRRSMRRR